MAYIPTLSALFFMEPIYSTEGCPYVCVCVCVFFVGMLVFLTHYILHYDKFKVSGLVLLSIFVI